VTRGEPRIRPFDKAPHAGSSHSRELARPRYPTDRDTSLGLRRWSVVPIDVHGSLDRVKDVSPIA